MTESMRPAPIDKMIYINFGSKCKKNGLKISDVLEKLCRLYLKKGKKIFED